MHDANHPLKPRRTMRLRGYDYRRCGIYFVTVCTHQHTQLFGWIESGKMRLTDLGEVVEKEWLHTAKARKGIQLGEFVVMPNHVHGLVIVTSEIDQSGSSADLTKYAQRSDTLQPRSLGAIVGHFKAAVSRRARTLGIDCNKPIWQRNYYDHIVRNEKSLNEIRQYIMQNPARWEEDSLYLG